ncbi:MAG: hypothetical protein AB1798_06865 [Spirochaetota bacterium]
MSEKPFQFNNYLHQEYSHIAEAHFKTNETISTFFKHYLAIMAIPIAITSYIITSEAKSPRYNQVTGYIIFLAGCLLIVISLAGFMVMLHIINLRLDSLLYARTVNGIRKFFYDSEDIDINIKLRMRTLPQTALLPAYYEKSYFLPVIFAFALLNSSYWTGGLWVLISYLLNLEWIKSIFGLNELMNYNSGGAIVGGLIFFITHFLFYWRFARHRETGYLKSNIIGIDIDGVLNRHRDHFCYLLAKKTGKEIKTEQITHIPVHEADLGVTREDERLVFNDPKYWIDMPVEDTTPDNLKKLRNIFKFKLFIFTHRPWPNLLAIEKKDRKLVIDYWRRCLCDYESLVYSALSKWKKIRMWSDYVVNFLFDRFKSVRLIRRLTILWLRHYGFKYDNLVIEKGNEDITDPRGNFRNRFQLSRKKKIRFFVEDDLEKAVKLSFICDVVFLIAHPYNESARFGGTSIPSNIVRVKSWNAIYRHIRRLS